MDSVNSKQEDVDTDTVTNQSLVVKDSAVQAAVSQPKSRILTMIGRKPTQAVVTRKKKLSMKNFTQLVESKAAEATVLDDGSLHVVDTDFSNDIIYKKHTEMSKVEPESAAVFSFFGAAILLTATLAVSNNIDPTAAFFLPLAPILAIGGIKTSFIRNQQKKEFNEVLSSPEAIKTLQITVTQWLEDQYNIKVPSETAKEITKSLLHGNYLRFTDGNSKEYVITKDEPRFRKKGWLIREVLELPEVDPYFTLQSKTDKEKGFGTVTKEDIENMVTFSPDHQIFNEKAALLKQQELTPEHEYAINRAQQEVYSIVQSAALLKQLGDVTYEKNVKDAFNILNQELDNILHDLMNQQRNDLAMKKQLIAERFRQPLSLNK